MENISDIGKSGYQKAKTHHPQPINYKYMLQTLLRLPLFYLLCVPVFLKKFFRKFYAFESKNICGQLALVTGGANGLGYATCLRLAEEGCNVAVVDMDMKNAEKASQDLQQLGIKSKAYQVDIADYKAVKMLKEKVENEMGHVEILINNAGIIPLLSLREGTEEEIQRIVDVNLTSHIWMCRTFIEPMIAKKRGHIVAISSMFGLDGYPYAITYSATKFGVRGLMASIFQELKLENLHKDVHTTCIFPWFISTRKDLEDNVLNKTEIFKSLPPITPKYAADCIIKAIRGNEKEVVVPSLYSGIVGMDIEYREVFQKVFNIDDLSRRTIKKE